MWTKLSEHARLTMTEQAPYVTFPFLAEEKGLVHGFSTRLGGVSRGCFASMNPALNRGDLRENVMTNTARLCSAMGILPEQLVYPKQTHKCFVRKATAADCGTGLFRDIPYEDVDAQITNEANVALVTFGSDCVPVYFYDPVVRAIGLAHAGWRGTVGGIVARTVEAMQEAYGSNPSDLKVVIGPSICASCFEIGPEVAAEFANAFPDAYEKTILRPGQGDRSHADLWRANEQWLLRAGVRQEQIVCSQLCTMCRQDLFFSHRGSGGKRGGNAGFLMLA